MSSPRPLMQKPLELGADCVVYSATKHIDGQGRCLGGVILGSKAFIETHIHNYLRQTGPSLSPFNAWVLLKGLETLPLRVAQQQDSAGKLADFLAGEAKISRVYYPGRPDHPQYELARRQMKGGSTMVAFDVAGGKAEAFRMANAFEIIKISNNLGDSKSLVTHPATTTHQRLTEEARLRRRHRPGHVAPLGRAGGCRGPDRRSQAWLGGRVRRKRRHSFRPPGSRRRICYLARASRHNRARRATEIAMRLFLCSL